jgi:hypothetical protein
MPGRLAIKDPEKGCLPLRLEHSLSLKPAMYLWDISYKLSNRSKPIMTQVQATYTQAVLIQPVITNNDLQFPFNVAICFINNDLIEQNVHAFLMVAPTESKPLDDLSLQ